MEKQLAFLERLFLAPVLWIFDRVAAKISYVFAVSLVTSFGGWVIALFIGIFLFSLVEFDNDHAAGHFLVLFTVATFALYTLGYYLHFGLMRRFKIPEFQKDLRIITASLHGKFISPKKSNKELQDLFLALNRLPVINVRAAFIYPSMVMLLVTLQEVLMGTLVNAVFVLAGVLSAVILYAFFTYITAEMLTAAARRHVKMMMVHRHMSFNEPYSFSIRQKFFFISILVMIFMGQLSCMFYFGDMSGNHYLAFIFTAISVWITASIMFLYLISILQCLDELEKSATNLAKGGKGKLYLSSLDRELVKLGTGLISAAYEVNDIRDNLERRVARRTRSLKRMLDLLKKRDAVMQKELDLASDIQQGVLPELPYRHNNMVIEGFYQSMEKVGGDIFDIVELQNGSLAVVIADVSGHGVPAALITTLFKISVLNACNRHSHPKEILEYINRSMTSLISTDDYLTSFVVVIDPGCRVTYSNASHQKALLFNENRVSRLDTMGHFVGLFDDPNYEEKQTTLYAGNKLFLFTDGLVELKNKNGEELGAERLEKFILHHMDLPAPRLKEKLVELADSWCHQKLRKDDLTFLVIDSCHCRPPVHGSQPVGGYVMKTPA